MPRTARKPDAPPPPVPLNERVGPLQPPQPRLERKTYTVKEAAQVLGVGRHLVYDAIKAGRFNVIKLGLGGRRIVIPREAIENLLRTGTETLKS